MANWTTINANWYGNADASVPAIPFVPTGSSGGPLGVYGGSNVEFAESSLAGRDAGDQAGFFVVTLNGTGPAGTVNWIDGTQTLEYPPTGILMARHDPPAFTASSATTAPPYPNPLAVYYPVGYVVLGSGHVQQVTVAGVVGTSAPSWSTSGGTVVSGSATFKDLGAIDAGPVYPIALTAITSTSATLTLSGNGTNTQVAVISFRIYGHN
jgi:hypothetical protein